MLPTGSVRYGAEHRASRLSICGIPSNSKRGFYHFSCNPLSFFVALYPCCLCIIGLWADAHQEVPGTCEVHGVQGKAEESVSQDFGDGRGCVLPLQTGTVTVAALKAAAAVAATAVAGHSSYGVDITCQLAGYCSNKPWNIHHAHDVWARAKIVQKVALRWTGDNHDKNGDEKQANRYL